MPISFISCLSLASCKNTLWPRQDKCFNAHFARLLPPPMQEASRRGWRRAPGETMMLGDDDSRREAPAFSSQMPTCRPWRFGHAAPCGVGRAPRQRRTAAAARAPAIRRRMARAMAHYRSRFSAMATTATQRTCRAANASLSRMPNELRLS